MWCFVESVGILRFPYHSFLDIGFAYGSWGSVYQRVSVFSWCAFLRMSLVPVFEYLKQLLSEEYTTTHPLNNFYIEGYSMECRPPLSA